MMKSGHSRNCVSSGECDCVDLQSREHAIAVAATAMIMIGMIIFIIVVVVVVLTIITIIITNSSSIITTTKNTNAHTETHAHTSHTWATHSQVLMVRVVKLIYFCHYHGRKDGKNLFVLFFIRIFTFHGKFQRQYIYAGCVYIIFLSRKGYPPSNKQEKNTETHRQRIQPHSILRQEVFHPECPQHPANQS